MHGKDTEHLKITLIPIKIKLFVKSDEVLYTHRNFREPVPALIEKKILDKTMYDVLVFRCGTSESSVFISEIDIQHNITDNGKKFIYNGLFSMASECSFLSMEAMYFPIYSHPSYIIGIFCKLFVS